jgi:hypothetical protein
MGVDVESDDPEARNTIVRVRLMDVDGASKTIALGEVGHNVVLLSTRYIRRLGLRHCSLLWEESRVECGVAGPGAPDRALHRS